LCLHVFERGNPRFERADALFGGGIGCLGNADNAIT
jgi:hypothetical protein